MRVSLDAPLPCSRGQRLLVQSCHTHAWRGQLGYEIADRAFITPIVADFARGIPCNTRSHVLLGSQDHISTPVSSSSTESNATLYLMTQAHGSFDTV